ncbi:MAG: general secretion pathway protein GspK [Bryobacteraceae bacterium]
MLWLSAALSSIAFSVATTVRGELDRASTFAEGTRTHYLATGAIDRAILHILWGAPYWEGWMPEFRFSFPGGEAVVEIIPEAAKLGLNHAPPEMLAALLVALGEPEPRAREIAEAIVDWRTPAPGGFSPFDRHYLSLVPSFRPRHASFEQEEELLLVKGVTTDLFYGGYRPGPDNRLLPIGGLRDCVSVFSGAGPFDMNSTPPALLAAIGVPAGVVDRIVAARPARTSAEFQALREIAGPAAARLGGPAGTIYTLRATAWLRLPDGKPADLRRTVSATVKLWRGENGFHYQTLRWRE